jgi:hypothetical protein
MTIIKSILRRSGFPVRGEAPGSEVDDELQFHIEMRARDNIASGMTQEDAMADAMRRFGDFDRIRTACKEIKKERQAGFMKLVKGFIWIVLGCGVALKLGAQLPIVQVYGNFLIFIAILWRLLIFLRERQPDQRRILAAERPTLGGMHAASVFSVDDFAEVQPRYVPPFDKDGRTPVERLISDESSKEP